MQRPGLFNSWTRTRRPRSRSKWTSRSSGPRIGIEVLEERRLLAVTPGTWTSVSNPIPDTFGAQVMLLLSDGTVMARGGGGASNLWYKLTPNSSGSYSAGSWSTLATSGLERLYSPSEVLPDGRVFLLGGEYSGPNTDATFDNTGEIYDPVSDTWTNITDFPQAIFGDDPTEMLPDGRILAGYLSGPETYIYNPATDTWSQTGSKLRNDSSDEESWVKLPDDSILSYDVFSSIDDAVGHAQRYVPSQGTWVDAGTPPDLLSSPDVGYELGPAFLLPDGRAFFLGGNGKTAFYTPATNTWDAGPDIPNGMTCADAPGAMLPNGHVLFAASPIGGLDATGTYTFPPPTNFFEFDPIADTYTDVTPSIFDPNANSFLFTMLVLPSGQIMVTGSEGPIGIYTPAGSPEDAWRPTIDSVTANGTTFTLTGTQLNGLSEGAAYGDDNEMASNYPIIQLRDTAGNIAYARTFNWSSTGVATGDTPVSVDFTLPASFTGGEYSLTVIANGIASAAVQINLGSFSIPSVSQDEGDSGLTPFVFTITQPASINGVTLTYATADGTAQAGSDYIPTSGELSFAPGETTKQITVDVIGDITAEPDETFFIALNDTQTPQVGPQIAVGTIINDDINLSINDITILEGDSGTKNAVFTVVASGVTSSSTTVNWQTVDGTAVAASDYLAEAGALTFPPGGGTATITVPIVGDTLNESTETFSVVLSNVSKGHLIKPIGVGTILDNDPLPSLYVNDVQVKTTQAGQLNAVFTVALDAVSGQFAYVDFDTSDDGSAVAGVDYQPTSGVLTFAPGARLQTITVPVITHGVYAPNEHFFVNLFSGVHALLGDDQGAGTIIFAPRRRRSSSSTTAMPATARRMVGPRKPTCWPTASTTTTTPPAAAPIRQSGASRAFPRSPTRSTRAGPRSATAPPTRRSRSSTARRRSARWRSTSNSRPRATWRTATSGKAWARSLRPQASCRCGWATMPTATW